MLQVLLHLPEDIIGYICSFISLLDGRRSLRVCCWFRDHLQPEARCLRLGTVISDTIDGAVEGLSSSSTPLRIDSLVIEARRKFNSRRRLGDLLPRLLQRCVNVKILVLKHINRDTDMNQNLIGLDLANLQGLLQLETLLLELSPIFCEEAVVQGLSSLSRVRSLVTLQVHSREWDASMLKAIGQLTQLRQLTLGYFDFRSLREDSFQVLAPLEKLQRLCFYNFLCRRSPDSRLNLVYLGSVTEIVFGSDCEAKEFMKLCDSPACLPPRLQRMYIIDEPDFIIPSEWQEKLPLIEIMTVYEVPDHLDCFQRSFINSLS